MKTSFHRLSTLEQLRMNKEANESILQLWLKVKEEQRRRLASDQFHQVFGLTKDLVACRESIVDITFSPDSFDGRYFVNAILNEFKDDFPQLFGCIRPFPIECYIEYGSKWAADDIWINAYFSLVQMTNQFIVDNKVVLMRKLFDQGQCSLF